MPNAKNPSPRRPRQSITRPMARQLYVNMQHYVEEAIDGVIAVPVYQDRYAPYLTQFRPEMTAAFLAPFKEVLIGPSDQARYHPPRTLTALMDEIADNYELTSQRVQNIEHVEKPEFNLFYEIYLGLCEHLRADATMYLNPPPLPDQRAR
jgi:hypothetical protein